MFECDCKIQHQSNHRFIMPVTGMECLRCGKREDRYQDLKEWALSAMDLIDKATDIMTLEQIGQWESCRYIAETFPLKRR